MSCRVPRGFCQKIKKKKKEKYPPATKVVEDMKQVLGPLFPESREIKLYRGKPTPENDNSGYIGRIAIFEVLPVSEKISRLILERRPASDIEKLAREEGMITLKQDGYMKALEGITSLEEVLRVGQE